MILDSAEIGLLGRGSSVYFMLKKKIKIIHFKPSQTGQGWKGTSMIMNLQPPDACRASNLHVQY